jgi:error-prone DNA polymerase
VYASAWLKRHHPAAFACALLNSQPMGFYAPAQIVRDAREHGVEVRAIDVNCSEWDCTLEAGKRRSDGATKRRREGEGEVPTVGVDGRPAAGVSAGEGAAGGSCAAGVWRGSACRTVRSVAEFHRITRCRRRPSVASRRPTLRVAWT